MKYSQPIGVVLILLFVLVAFFPWIYIPDTGAPVTGMGSSMFGRPALFNLFCCVFSLVFFAIPRLWAKRANIFFATMNLAWALKNFIILSICRQGACPDRRPGLYLMFLATLGILVMAFLPRVSLTSKRAPEE